MKYNVHISGTADADLNSAVDYIDHILLNPQAADELLIEAEEAIADLATFPEKYALVTVIQVFNDMNTVKPENVPVA